MFRKFHDRVVAAASTALGISTTQNATTTTQEMNVQRLQVLGNYTVAEAEFALHATGGNVDRAAELLLSQQAPHHSHAADTNMYTETVTPTERSVPNNHDEDMELQQALQQSLDDSNVGINPRTTAQPTRTAAMDMAAEAAIRRAEVASTSSRTRSNKTKKLSSSTHVTKTDSLRPSGLVKENVAAVPIRTKSQMLRHHHPDVKLIPKLQDKSIEEQVLRTVDRMKNHAAAVDTMHRALSMIYHNPKDMKYRRIDTSTPGYQRSVAGAPGAQDFLRAMKFFQEGFGSPNVLVLSESMYDPALIYLGFTALEQIKATPEYVSAKAQLVFVKGVTTLLEAKKTTHETNQRNQYQSQCPTEPSEGRGALLQVHLIDSHTIRRRFDSDDTVADVLYWIGSMVGSDIYQRIIDGTWCLVDVNHANRLPLDVQGAATNLTLQYVGCWPSGRLQLQPSFSSTAQQDAATPMQVPWNKKIGNSRGLASGASSSDDE
jgi:PUB domain